ncbi:MAG: hypothetical protein ACE5I3_08945 [Phycisphaerae bacterium]
MQPTITLRYARQRKHWTRRRKITFALLVVSAIGGGSLGYFAYYTVRPRVQFLNNHPWLKPVDWSAVLSSPALCKLAWKFSSHRAAIGLFIVDPDGVGGVSLFGTDPNSVELDLLFPLTHAKGKLKLRFAIRNKGRNALLVPVFGQPWSHFHEPAAKRPTDSPEIVFWELGPSRWLTPQQALQSRLGWADLYDMAFSPPRRQRGLPDRVRVQLRSLSVDCSAARGPFSRGVRVLKPGEMKTVELSVPAPQRPVMTSINVHGTPTVSSPWTYWFQIHVGAPLLGGYTSWEEVPRSAVRKERLFQERPPLPARFKGRTLPPMLFPDERRPKLWEMECLS